MKWFENLTQLIQFLSSQEHGSKAVIPICKSKIVAKHYLERGAYIAAINRAKYALEQYSGAPATIESLEIIANAYNSLGMDDLAEQAESIFLANQTKDPNQTIVLEESEPWYKFW